MTILQTRDGYICGLLPICASCKKIRDDKGQWNQMESYSPLSAVPSWHCASSSRLNVS